MTSDYVDDGRELQTNVVVWIANDAAECTTRIRDYFLPWLTLVCLCEMCEVNVTFLNGRAGGYEISARVTWVKGITSDG